MLILVAWASFTIVAPTEGRPTSWRTDSIQAQQQDTLGRKKPGLPSKEITPREQSQFRQTVLFGMPPDQQTNRRQFGRIVDSLFRSDPLLKAPLLKELLIPSVLPVGPPKVSELDSLNQQLARNGRFSAFERMGLIARHYSNVNPNAKSYSTHQIDIIGTFLWLSEILK